ncbi:MAG: GAF domain-containing protein [Anaerolineae bacterium]|nr:GAF domain-containing protein [Anaerolineae bacterium]
MNLLLAVNSIRSQLVRIILLISIITVLGVAVIAVSAYSTTLRRETESALVNSNQVFAHALDSQLQGVIMTARTLAAAMADQPPAPLRQVWQIASNILGDSNTLIRRVIVYASGSTGHQIVMFNQPRSPLRVATAAQWIDSDIDGDVWFMKSFSDGMERWNGPADSYDPFSVQPVFSYAVPFRGPDRFVNGVAWVDVSTATLERAMDRLMYTPIGGATGYSLLLSDQNQLVATYHMDDGVPESARAEALEAFLARPDINRIWNDAQSSSGAFYLGSDLFDLNTEAVILVNRLPQSGWRLVTFMPPAMLQNPFTRSIVPMVAVTILGMSVLAWAVHSFVKRSIAEPLEELGKAAQEIGGGDMRFQIAHQDKRDEIGQLANAMEDMKRQLAYSYQQLSMWSQTLEKRVAQRTEELALAQKVAQNNATELQAVYDASLAVVSDYQLDIVLQKLTENMISLLNANYCAVWLLTNSKQHLQLVATTGVKSRLNMIISVEDGLVGAATREARLLILDDYRNWPHRLENLADAEVYQAMAAPLSYYNRPIGAVFVGRGENDAPFSEPDQRLLTLFANLVSPVLRNAQLYIQREEAMNEAERANSVKTRFLASVTHELRTPLNLIINNLDFMRVGMFGDITAEQRNRLDQTIRSSEHLLALINDLLDVSKIEAGEMELTVMPSDLRPVLEDALDSAVMLIDAKKAPITLEADIPEDLPYIPMDARRIRQVLTNLLSNAVKFTPAGSIRLQVGMSGEYIEFAVEDTGIGISAEEMENLFQPFERSDRAKFMSIEGTGLGLAISKHLVEAHGGEFRVESQVGVGSLFMFRLPMRTNHKKAITKPLSMTIGSE